VMWDSPASRTFNYLDLDDWIALAKELERAKFDAFFWADHSSVHDVYRGTWETAVREAVQFPLGDPFTLSSALASSTQDLGFAFSANIIQDHPYTFARRLSTLDHLTKGRIAWNIVTSWQPSAWANLGRNVMGSHSERYLEAEEYLTVLYKLLEGSWEDGAVVRDMANRVYADVSKVRKINHIGHFYAVPGVHTNEPSPQRMPVLFQAGSSDVGRTFAARHAEAMFLAGTNARGVRAALDDMRRRLAGAGREASDLLPFLGQKFVVGSTEEEAKRKDREFEEYLSSETMLAFGSSTMGVDLSTVDVDTPIGELETQAVQGQFKALAEAAPDKSFTFRDVVMRMFSGRLVGTPEQIADAMQEWHDLGVKGINLGMVRGWDDIYDITQHVVPVLQARGLMQTDYSHGTFREKMFAGTPSDEGARINHRHPAARYRRHPAQPEGACWDGPGGDPLP